MPVDSLVDMARRACMKSSRGITDIGDTPYELLRPVLLKIENPQQLRTLEQNCPQIIGKDREIWLSMLKRDIPDYESKPHEPSDPKNWYKVYRKLKREAQQEEAAGDERLRAALNNAQAKKGATTKIMAAHQLPRPTVRKRQAITYDYLSGRTGSKGAHKLSLMEKIRKEAKGASSTKMARPTHELQNRSSRVVKAPQSFIRDIKQQNLAKMPLAEAREAMGYTQVGAPKPLPRPSGSPYNLTQDREARLRELKSGKRVENRSTVDRPKPGGSESVNTLTLDFLEDDDDDDELFGSSSNQRGSSPQRQSTPQRQNSPQPRKISPQPATVKRKEPPKMFMTGQHSKRKRPSPDIT